MYINVIVYRQYAECEESILKAIIDLLQIAVSFLK